MTGNFIDPAGIQDCEFTEAGITAMSTDGSVACMEERIERAESFQKCLMCKVDPLEQAFPVRLYHAWHEYCGRVHIDR
jgi:hypothetical protein